MGDLIRFDVARLSEKDFQKIVVNIALTNGWWQYHNPDSRRSASGWPDLTLIREPEIIFVELKAEKGRIRPDQQIILDKLSACGLENHIWRPRDLDKIHGRLSTKGTSCSPKESN